MWLRWEPQRGSGKLGWCDEFGGSVADRSVAHARVVLGQQVPGEVAAQVAPHGVDVIGPSWVLSYSMSRLGPLSA